MIYNQMVNRLFFKYVKSTHYLTGNVKHKIRFKSSNVIFGNIFFAQFKEEVLLRNEEEFLGEFVTEKCQPELA